MIVLSKRLAAVASFAADGVSVADVGTDHGYIPVYLAELGRAKRIVASDVREGPLESARRSAAAYGVADRIEFRLADGLDGLGADFDTVVIAGLGGDTITDVLARAPWTRDETLLVLQPQSKVSRLTRWLYGNGYFVEDAALSEDGGKVYLVLAVCGGKAEAPEGEAGYLADPALFRRRDPLLGRYLAGLRRKLTLEDEGMAGGRDTHAARVQTEAALDGIKKMIAEVEEWR